MVNSAFILPALDPILVSIGPLAIRWYSLAYIGGILFAWWMLKHFNHNPHIMPIKAWDAWLSWAVIGIVVGGRLGYVLFYDLALYCYYPLEIFKIWHGGLSFHGGLAGLLISMSLFCHKYRLKFLNLTDILAVAAPLGIFLGRLANFVNMELYGRVTDSQLGIIFPNAGLLPRHPSQLYEAVLEGLLPFIILFLLINLSRARQRTGLLSGLFLTFYSLARLFSEQFREPDAQLGFLFNNFLTMGQILSLPLLVAGIWLIWIASKRKRPQG